MASCGNILTSKFKYARRPTESKHAVNPPSVNASRDVTKTGNVQVTRNGE